MLTSNASFGRRGCGCAVHAGHATNSSSPQLPKTSEGWQSSGRRAAQQPHDQPCEGLIGRPHVASGYGQPGEMQRHLGLIAVSDYVGEFFNDIRHQRSWLECADTVMTQCATTSNNAAHLSGRRINLAAQIVGPEKAGREPSQLENCTCCNS